MFTILKDRKLELRPEKRNLVLGVIMYTYKTIIFDLDGTLFKTDTIFVDAVYQLCQSREIELIDKKKITKLIGKTSFEVCQELFGGNLGRDEIEGIRTELRTNEDKIFARSAQLYDGVKEILTLLKNDGYTLGLCTNDSNEYVNRILGHFNIKQHFDIIKYRVDGLEKYQLIKQILEESACCSAIVVGDTNVDFEAAEEVRCISIGVSYGYGENDYQKFDFVANNPLDIYRTVKNINGVYKEIANQILSRKQGNKPIIVGINGVDTSGKSTFTKGLERYIFKTGFKSQIVAIDDFHNPSHIRNKEKDPVISYYNNAFDIKKIEDELMKPIAANGVIDKELLLLDIEKNEFTNRKRYIVDEDTIILFEGVLLYRAPLNQYFDLRIFIDITFDEVLVRAVKRDANLFGDAIIERYNNKYIPIQKLYFKQNAPKELSDIIIDNNDYCNPKVIKQPNLNKSADILFKLEDIEEKHLCEIDKMAEDNETREMLGVFTVSSLNDFTLKNNISKAIINKNNEFIGVVELFNISWRNRRAELSIAIKPQMRERGYGCAAINKMLEIAFVEHGIYRVHLRVIETNIKAINLYKKVGFIQEGVCRGESLRKGKFANQIQMSILPLEWIKNINSKLE